MWAWIHACNSKIRNIPGVASSKATFFCHFFFMSHVWATGEDWWRDGHVHVEKSALQFEKHFLLLWWLHVMPLGFWTHTYHHCNFQNMFHCNVYIFIVITASVVFLYWKDWGKKLIWNYAHNSKTNNLLRFFLQEEQFLYLKFFLQLTVWEKSSGMGARLVIIL
jgi:hypothetical protein